MRDKNWIELIAQGASRALLLLSVCGLVSLPVLYLCELPAEASAIIKSVSAALVGALVLAAVSNRAWLD